LISSIIMVEDLARPHHQHIIDKVLHVDNHVEQTN
jgi:hypothetical protein